MRRSPALLIALAALILPAAAAAKELGAAELCDAKRCVTVHDRAAVEAINDGSMPEGPPLLAERGYPLTIHVTHEGDDVGTIPLRWMPRAGLVERTGETGEARYYEPTAAARVALDRLTARLTAEPAAARTDASPGAGSGFPWALAGTAAAAAVALLAAAAALARRRGPGLAR